MSRSRVTAAVAIAALLVVVVVLRELTMAVRVPPDQSAVLALVLDQEVRYEPAGSGRERAEARARTCALEVEAEVPPDGVRDLPGHRLLVLVTPAVQGVDRDELRGCIEDLAVRRMIVDVVEMREVPLGAVTA